MRKFTGVRRSWRVLIVVASIAIGAIAAPSSASAIGYACPLSANVTSNYYCGQPAAHHPYAGFQGWGYVQGASHCPVGAYCFAAAQQVPAWRWNGSWSSVTLRDQEQVYIYPYAEGWSWVWTQRTGWLAAADSYVWVRSYYDYTAAAGARLP